MAAPAKFLFNLDFSSGEDEQAEQASKAELEQAVAEAEVRGHRAGYAAAQADASIEAQRRLAAAIEQIGSRLAQMGAGLSDIERRLEAEAVEVAVAVATKLAPELIAREPFAEIAALATDCFRHLVATPHVVVRVNDALHGAAREKLAETTRAGGFDGRLVVLAEPDIALGDCRIEWADGGIKRDSAAVETAITAAVTSYIAARRGES